MNVEKRSVYHEEYKDRKPPPERYASNESESESEKN